MTDEAPLERWPTGLVPQRPGWFVVNVRDAAWSKHLEQGHATLFEKPRGQPMPELGIRVRILRPGQVLSYYPVSALAARYRASAATETTSPDEAYEGTGEWDLGRPDGRFPWDG